MRNAKKTAACAAAGALIVAGLAVSACGGQVTAVEEKPAESAQAKPSPLTPVLAKAHLTDAAAAARKWRSDAVITQLAGRRVPDDGKITQWEYLAWSPSAKMCLGITFTRGNVNTQEAGDQVCQREPLGEIIDSDQAIKIARANGVTKQDVSMVAMASPARKGQSVWSVAEEGMRNPGNIALDIDAGTGKVLATTKTP
jgi:hypothetical protein